MNLSCVLFGLLFLGTGALFAAGKLHVHMSFWKRMDEAEREAVDIVPLCKNIGGMIALSGGIFLLGGLSRGFLSHGFVWAMIAWMVLSGIDVWHIGKSGAYQKSGQEQKEHSGGKERQMKSSRNG